MDVSQLAGMQVGGALIKNDDTASELRGIAPTNDKNKSSPLNSIKHTPRRSCAEVGHKKGFEDALQRFRGKDADISEEAAEISDYTETLQRLSEARVLDLFQRKYAHSLLIGVGLMVSPQLGVDTVPVLVGPVSYLLLSKPAKGVEKSFSPLSFLGRILPIYKC
ncbi:hypothetical protein IFM89_037156 [Coptis chinensis]|uniref:Uncharacterized protein n=1 Tax=Coptis chinensis TaxID=261450 RepID=A0A835M5Y8_9MAGN|nr:hypothetical protein IFM89_037156 [Coptis chinensis]